MKIKHLRVPLIALGIIGLLSIVGSVSQIQGAGDQPFNGASYLATIKDSAGNFASRAVFTLHADQTMSGMDSDQDGPTYFFSSQRGSWKPGGPHKIVARMIDFLFLPSGPVIARLDYTIRLARDHGQVRGTITLRIFPLEDEDLLDGAGEFINTFTFVGELITP